MLKSLSILFVLWLTTFCAAASNEVSSLPSQPVDSITEKGVVVSLHKLSNSGGCLSFWLDLRAFSLENDFVISGAEYFRGFDKLSTPTITPFTLTIPHESTVDSVVLSEIKLDFPLTHVFNHNDTLSLETSEGRMIIYTGVNIPPDNPQSFLKRYRSWIIGGVVLLAIVVVILVVNIYAKRLKRIRRENLSAHSDLCIIRQQNDELNQKIESLFGERLEVLNKICNEYFEKKDAEIESVKLSIYKEVERIILSFGSRNSIDTIEKTVNTYRNDILKRLREQVPSLSATDIKTITYLYAGFSPKAVCIFTNCKIKNFYNRRLRLREKISNSDAPDRDEFLSRLEQ